MNFIRKSVFLLLVAVSEASVQISLGDKGVKTYRTTPDVCNSQPYPCGNVPALWAAVEKANEWFQVEQDTRQSAPTRKSAIVDYHMCNYTTSTHPWVSYIQDGHPRYMYIPDGVTYKSCLDGMCDAYAFNGWTFGCRPEMKNATYLALVSKEKTDPDVCLNGWCYVMVIIQVPFSCACTRMSRIVSVAPPGGQPTWTSWSEWTSCSVSCDRGYQSRTRSCDGGGCPGEGQESKSCIAKLCPGIWGLWSQWTNCPVTCGDGKMTRIRRCDREICTGNGKQNKPCKNPKCVKEGGTWTPWSPWTPCSPKCGAGEQIRKRSCVTETCPGDALESVACTTQCHGGRWNLWQSWSLCSASCGSGKQTRERTCDGDRCVGSARGSKPCLLRPCTGFKVCQEYCQYPGTDSTGRANENCFCNCKPGYGGTKCQLDLCQCSENGTLRKERREGRCDCTCKPGFQDSKCDKDICQMCQSPGTKTRTPIEDSCSCTCADGYGGSWCQEDICDQCQEPGTKSITRGPKVCTCNCYPGFDGDQCQYDRCQPCFAGAIRAVKPLPKGCKCVCKPGYSGKLCQTPPGAVTTKAPEPLTTRPPTFSRNIDTDDRIWGAWSVCSASCGQGEQVRTRPCRNNNCQASDGMTQTCMIRSCTGNWLEWSSWTKCSKSCDDGHVSRTRSCDFITCIGESTDMKPCNLRPCSGSWSVWSDWSACSPPCGAGQQRRTRTCSMETCTGSYLDTKSCTTQCDGIQYRCNMDADFCGMVNADTDDFDWIRHRGTTSTAHTGPLADHTSGKGYYMYTESSSPQAKNQKAQIMITVTPSEELKCLQFWYHMYGNDTGVLTVYGQFGYWFKDKLWSRSGNYGNEWQKAEQDLQLGCSSIEFESKIGGYLSDIAIDDIIIYQGACYDL